LQINEIKTLAKNDRIAFKNHAILRMHERKIFADEIKDALLNGEIIEEYEENLPLPSHLILGATIKGKLLHIVVAIDSDFKMLWIITVYEPSLDRWEEDYRTRRKK